VKEGNSIRKQNVFVGGRVALRRSIETLCLSTKYDTTPILVNRFGAPDLDLPITGSISHKDDLAVGFVKSDVDGRVGVDIEKLSNKASDRLYDRILTSNEKKSVGSLVCKTSHTSSTSRTRTLEPRDQTLLYFSFKESVYKALHPYLIRSIDFKEVEIFPKQDNTASISFNLVDEKKFVGHGYWELFTHDQNDYFITCVLLNPVK
jgi:enterobactin synthetase component D